MRKKAEIPSTIGNVLKLLTARVKEFKDTSRRSYQKAFASLQLYVAGHYRQDEIFNLEVLENWVVSGMVSGMSLKTMAFYIDKTGSLYSRTAHRLEGNKQQYFKDIKKKLKDYGVVEFQYNNLNKIEAGVKKKWIKHKGGERSALIEGFLKIKDGDAFCRHKALKSIWCALALKADVKASEVIGILGEIPEGMEILNIATPAKPSPEQTNTIYQKIEDYIKGEPRKWFAMRLRPKVNYDQLLQRMERVKDEIRWPELFYPMEEVTRRVGIKLVSTGRPVIHDVIFFRSRHSDVYPMIHKLYDLAWCYKNPGNRSGYASIPDEAMRIFKRGLGMLTDEYEVAPIGELALEPGDRVEIISDEYFTRQGTVIKKEKNDDEGNVVYRISLMHQSGRWDIGIDARLLKKK